MVGRKNGFGIFDKLRSLDAYPKVNEDFYSRTFSGGVITLVSAVIILLLFFSEISLFFNSATETKLIVDTSRGERLLVNFDITFPSLACSLISVDSVDISGEQHYDIRHDITKTRIDYSGKVIASRQDGIGATKIERPLQRHGGRLEGDEAYCGSCFGAESSDEHCCNSCEEVHEAYKKKAWRLANPELIDQCVREGFFQQIKEEKGEGCNINGFLNVSKVAGNFHFAAGKSLHHSDVKVGDLLNIETGDYNISHKINKLSFGKAFPGAVNPLDGVQWVQASSSGAYQYFIKVVPTIYTDLTGNEIQSNQFSVTEHFGDGGENQKPVPGTYFFYDFSPIKVIFTEEKKSVLHFLTNLCAIVGGVFTIAGIIDSFVYHGQRAIRKKKQDLGKYM